MRNKILLLMLLVLLGCQEETQKRVRGVVVNPKLGMVDFTVNTNTVKYAFHISSRFDRVEINVPLKLFLDIDKEGEGFALCVDDDGFVCKCGSC